MCIGHDRGSPGIESQNHLRKGQRQIFTEIAISRPVLTVHMERKCAENYNKWHYIFS